jgi:acyl-CoA-binding protein
LEALFQAFNGSDLYDRPSYRSNLDNLMSTLDARFESAQIDVKALAEKPGNMTLLRLYALFKQATHGDAHGEKPGFADIVGKYKYEAWASLKGMGQEQAKEQYVELVQSLKSGASH